MSQEKIYSQSSNSQNDNGQQTLEEIKTRSEIIIKQKCEDDFKLNNLQKDHQDFQKLIEERSQQISDAEKEHNYLENTYEQLEITRNSVKTDVDMIQKSVAEYSEVFNGLKTSIQNIKSDFNQNEEIIKSYNKIQGCETNTKYQEKLREFNYKKELLKDLKESNAKFKNGKNKLLENRKMKILNLEIEEPVFLLEYKTLENKNEVLKKEYDLKNILNDDLKNDLKIKQEKYDVVFQKFQTEKNNCDKQTEELDITFNILKEKITDLQKISKELDAERKTQNTSTEETTNEIKSLEKYLHEFENKVKQQEQENIQNEKSLEELRSDSSKIINEDEKLLETLNKKLHELNSSNDQIQFNIMNDKKIFDDLKNQEDLKKKEINSLQNNLKDLTNTIQENEIRYTEIINECNKQINEIKAQKQNSLDKKENLVTEKNNILKMISDLEQKKINRINESTQIEAKQNIFTNKINEEIKNLTNNLVIQEEDYENMKKNSDIKYEEISLKFKERKNEILNNTNQYKERMDIIEQQAEEAFKIEKNKELDEETKQELQISEFNAAIDNLQEEVKKINKQINLEASVKTKTEESEKAPTKLQNILKQNGPSISKLPEMKNNKKDVVAAKMFEWTTDEEEYKLQASLKLKATQSQIRSEKSKQQNTQKILEMTQMKKESTKQNIKKLLIDKISSTDTEIEWIKPNKSTSRKTK